MPGPTLKEKLQAKHTPAKTISRDPAILTRDVHGDNFIDLDMYIRGEDGDKHPISLSDILQLNTKEGDSSSSPITNILSKMLFEGDPGVGKSITLQRILELYATGELEQFDHAFLIKLDLLLDPYWEAKYANHIRTHPLACLVHASLEQIVRARGRLDDNFITLDEIIELFAQEDQTRTLFVADGYDKIAHLIGDKSIKDFITQMLEFDNVFMSARPNTMVPLINNAFDNTIIIEGLSGERVKTFVKTYLIIQANILNSQAIAFFERDRSEHKTAETLLSSLRASSNQASFTAFFQLEKILEKHKEITDLEEIKEIIDEYYKLKIDKILSLAKANHVIKELLSNPMHATMICMQDIDSPETLTLSNLYRGLINRLGEQVIPVNEIIKGEPIENLPELLILKRLAWREFTQGGISGQVVTDEIGDKSNLDRLLAIGILESSSASTAASPLHRNTYHSERDLGGRASEILDNRTFKFIDRSILEYLAACAFKDILTLEKGSPLAREAAEFIASHRHETKYLTFLKFVAGMIGDLEDQNQIAISRFWEAVACAIHETVETGIDKPVILWMHLLSQVMIDETPDPRIPNLKTIIDIIDNTVLSDFIRWKSAIESSGYLSEKILLFLEKQVDQASRNKVVFGNDKTPDIEDESKEEESKDDDIIVSQMTIGKPLEVARDISDTSGIILQVGSDDDEKEYATARHSRAHYQSMSPDITLAKAAIETYGYFFNLINNTRMFNLLFSNLSSNEDCRIIKPVILAIARIMKNHHLTEEQIHSFNNKLNEYYSNKYLESSALKAFRVIQAELKKDLPAMFTRSNTMEDDGTPMPLSASQTTLGSPLKRPVLKHEDTKLRVNLELPLEKISTHLRKSKNPAEHEYTIKLLIDYLPSNPTWLAESWGTRMTAILEILGYSIDITATSANPQLKKLAPIVERALQLHIKLANDSLDMLWLCYNFDSLQHLAKTSFNYVVGSILYQILSDNKITNAESEFICLCIDKLQISITIHPPKIVNGKKTYTIEYGGNTYTLHGFDNAKEVSKIIDVASTNKAELPQLTNTGSGIRIAASELPAYSIVPQKLEKEGNEIAEVKLSAENAFITFCYRSSHLRNKPTDVFILIERKGKDFGQYVVTKISVNNDGTLRISPNFYRHPDDIDGVFLVQIFGAMQYTETEKIRFLTQSIEVNIEEAYTILSQARSYTPEVPEEMSSSYDGLLSPNLFKSKSIKPKKSSKQPQDMKGKLSIEDEIDLLYELIKNLGMDITGDWEQDLLEDAGLTMHDRALTKSIDARHTLSFQIQLNENSAAIATFNAFTEKFNIDALTRVIKKEELTEHAKIEMEAIEQDIYKYALYKTIVLKINAFYIAVNAIYSEMVKKDKHGAAGKIGTLLGKLGPHVPVLGPVVEFIGELFTEADDVIAKTRIENFLEIALNSEQMAEISDKIARKITRLDLEGIQPSVRNTVAAATETLSNLVNNGPAQIIVQACKAFKDHIEEQQLDEEDREQKTREDEAKEHGEIIVKAIIESIFIKSYDPKLKVGTMMKSAAAGVKKVVKNDNEFKASQIVAIMQKKYNLHPLDGQTHGDQHGISLTGSGGSGDNLEQHEESHNKHHFLEPTGQDQPPVNSGSFGCGGGKSHCVVMAVPNIRYHDPAIQAAWETRNPETLKSHISSSKISEPVLRLKTTNYFLQDEIGIILLAEADRLYGEKAMLELKKLGLDQEVADQILSAVKETPEEIGAILDVFLSTYDKILATEPAEEALAIDHDKLISLYADAQRLYSKDAEKQIYQLVQNHEKEAAQLLLVASIMGNEYVLKEMFGESNEDNINDFETIVAAEYEEGYNIGGISQYIHNARFAENPILTSARNLIKCINNVYGELQELLFNDEYGDRFLQLLEQLPLLLKYAEKGQPAMPLLRPPYRGPGDDGDHGGGSGGSSGLFFEENNGDGKEDDFIEVLPYYGNSLNETKLSKLLIKLREPDANDYSS